MHEILWVGLEQALKHVCEVSHVEFVVEIRRRFAEIIANLRYGARLALGYSGKRMEIEVTFERGSCKTPAFRAPTAYQFGLELRPAF